MNVSNLQVLLAVDNPIVRKTMCAVLELLGHVVTSRDCGLRTLRTVHERRFDLILVDLHLTGADVAELLTAASQLQPQAVRALLCEADMPAWAQAYPCLPKVFGRVELGELLAGAGTSGIPRPVLQ